MDLLLDWHVDPLQLAPLLLVSLAYGRRARTLAARGTPVPHVRVVAFATGIAVAAIALASPVHALGERLFTFHMVQHLLLGDLAALALVAGLTGPLLRPLLAIEVVARLRGLGHPLVALPLWAANLLAWHLPPLYEAALTHDAVHALQHILFFSLGAIMWAPVVEVLPGPMWFGTAAKFGYVLTVRMLTTVLANVFFWAGTVFYATYDRVDPLLGLSPLADQATAGAVMMIEGSVVTLGALAWLFLKLWQEGELRQELLERGLDPRSVHRAVRYGRGEELQGER